MILLLSSQLVIKLQLRALSVQNLRLAIGILSRASANIDAALVDAVRIELQMVRVVHHGALLLAGLRLLALVQRVGLVVAQDIRDSLAAAVVLREGADFVGDALLSLLALARYRHSLACIETL